MTPGITGEAAFSDYLSCVVDACCMAICPSQSTKHHRRAVIPYRGTKGRGIGGATACHLPNIVDTGGKGICPAQGAKVRGNASIPKRGTSRNIRHENISCCLTGVIDAVGETVWPEIHDGVASTRQGDSIDNWVGGRVFARMSNA